MFICYKVCANIKPATIFFCIALLITLPLLANSRWKTKFQQSLTVNTDTIPVKNIDTLSSKKIIADTLKPADSAFKNSFGEELTIVSDIIESFFCPQLFWTLCACNLL